METTPHVLQDRARELQERMGPQVDELRKNFADFNTRASRFIKENPGTCLFGAVAVGYLIGKLASRR